ncbi:MAG: hypothetical protein SGPRY_004215 [Prymnesium sp.]
MPGDAKVPRFGIAPRRQLPYGGSSLSNRIQVLVDQLRREATVRTAVQELCLLASSSEPCRLAILTAGGDRQLMRVLRRAPDEPALLRWCLSTLNTLITSQWSRQRAQGGTQAVLALLDHKEAAVRSAAVQLLANLCHCQQSLDMVFRLGAVEKLAEEAEAQCEPGLMVQLRLCGIYRVKTPMAPVVSSEEKLAQLREEHEAIEKERRLLIVERQVSLQAGHVPHMSGKPVSPCDQIADAAIRRESYQHWRDRLSLQDFERSATRVQAHARGGLARSMQKPKKNSSVELQNADVQRQVFGRGSIPRKRGKGVGGGEGNVLEDGKMVEGGRMEEGKKEGSIKLSGLSTTNSQGASQEHLSRKRVLPPGKPSPPSFNLSENDTQIPSLELMIALKDGAELAIDLPLTARLKQQSHKASLEKKSFDGEHSSFKEPSSPERPAPGSIRQDKPSPQSDPCPAEQFSSTCTSDDVIRVTVRVEDDETCTLSAQVLREAVGVGDYGTGTLSERPVAMEQSLLTSADLETQLQLERESPPPAEATHRIPRSSASKTQLQPECENPRPAEQFGSSCASDDVIRVTVRVEDDESCSLSAQVLREAVGVGDDGACVLSERPAAMEQSLLTSADLETQLQLERESPPPAEATLRIPRSSASKTQLQPERENPRPAEQFSSSCTSDDVIRVTVRVEDDEACSLSAQVLREAPHAIKQSSSRLADLSGQQAQLQREIPSDCHDQLSSSMQTSEDMIRVVVRIEDDGRCSLRELPTL